MTTHTGLDAREALAERLVDATTHALETLSVHLGLELGLYQALADLGAATDAQLAATPASPSATPASGCTLAEHPVEATGTVLRAPPSPAGPPRRASPGSRSWLSTTPSGAFTACMAETGRPGAR
jgi:hypothetical protein